MHVTHHPSVRNLFFRDYVKFTIYKGGSRMLQSGPIPSKLQVPIFASVFDTIEMQIARNLFLQYSFVFGHMAMKQPVRLSSTYGPVNGENSVRSPCMHAYINTHKHAYIHACIYTYIYIHIA